MTVSYQEYLEAHLPADIPQTSYNPIYMASKTLYGQVESQTGFFDPNNLITLSEEGLAQIRSEVERDVIGQLQRDIGSYENSFLAGDGDVAAAENYTTRYADYIDTLAMGLVHDRLVVDGNDADDVRDIIRGAIDDFGMQSFEILDNTIALQSRIAVIADELDSRGMEALNYFESEISSLPENGRVLLREQIEARLEERLTNAPEQTLEIEAFRAVLDERLANISSEGVDAVSPEAPVIVPERAPGMP
ncbi:MAG: hypothetical protein ACK4VI_08600 [Alphaproteobacteria bacterium]